MGVYGSAAKAGVIAGLAAGAIASAWSYYSVHVTLPIIKEAIMEQMRKAGAPVTPELVEHIMSFTVMSATIGALIGAVIIGVLFGLFLVMFVRKLKYTWPIRGLIVGAIVYIVMMSFSSVASAMWGSQYAEIRAKLGWLSLAEYVVGIVEYMTYGLIYAYLIERWVERRQ